MSSFNTIVRETLTIVRNAQALRADYLTKIEALRAQCAALDRTQVRNKLTPPIAEFYGCSYSVAKSTGKLMLAIKSPGYAAADKALQRMTSDILASASPSDKPAREELEVPADILAAAKKLVALCAQYEQSAKLCATAVALARAK